MSNNQNNNSSNNNHELLQTLFNRYTSYHDQKENITYIGLGIELTLLTAVLSIEQWPPCSLIVTIKSNYCFIVFYYIIIIFILGFLHYFNRSQLRLKRWAAIKSNIMHKALLKAEPGHNENYNFKKCWFLKVIDHIIPLHCVSVGTDIKDEDFPKKINKYFNKENMKTKTKLQEWLISIFSLITIILIFLYSLI